MGNRFIPDGDVAFANMAEGFASTIARDPEKYTLEAHDSEMLTRKVKAFRAAMSQNHGARRSKLSKTGKDEARKEAEAIVRRLGRIIRASDQISNVDKAAVRIYPRDPRPTRRTVPQQPPYLRFFGVEHGSGRHILRFQEMPDITGRKKPHGAVRLELWVALVPAGQPVPRTPGESLACRPCYLRSFTSSPIRLQPPIPPVPMLVVYWACWADAKGNQGRFSQTCVARVEGWSTGITVDHQLGPMTDLKQLASDPMYITTITHLRQMEQLTVQQLLPDGASAAQATQLPAPPKQLPDAA